MSKKILLAIVYVLVSTSVFAQTKGTRHELNTASGTVPCSENSHQERARDHSVAHNLHLGGFLHIPGIFPESGARSCIGLARENVLPPLLDGWDSDGIRGYWDAVETRSEAEYRLTSNRIQWGIQKPPHIKYFQGDNTNYRLGTQSLLFELTVRF